MRMTARSVSGSVPMRLRGIDARIVQRDFDLARTVNDVAVREDETVARDNETGAATLARARR